MYIRRVKKSVEELEEPWSVLDVKKIWLQQCIKLSIKGWIVPNRKRSEVKGCIGQIRLLQVVTVHENEEPIQS